MVAAKIKALNHHFKHLVPVQVALLFVLATIGMTLGPLSPISADSTDYDPPSSFKAVPQSTASYSVALSWKAGAKHPNWVGTADGYYIEWLKGSTYIGEKYLSGYSSSSYTVSGLTCSTSYNFNVRAERADSQSKTKHAPESSNSTATATPTCPTATVSAVSAASTSSVNISWTTNFGTAFKLFIKAASGSSYGPAYSGGAKSVAIGNLACGTVYDAYVVATAGSQSGSNSVVKQGSTSACPVGTPKPTPSPAKPSSPGSSSSKSSPSTGSASTAAVSAPQPPGTPADFSAVVQSGKVVELSWDPSDATAGIASYNLQRSTDNATWNNLATPSGTTTSYEDDSADFSATYYYRLQAMDGSGNVSDFATTQVTTDDFQTTSNTVTSQDKLVSLTVPSGAFDQSTDCSISSTDNATASGSNKQSILAGPYSVLCVGQDGSVITTFKKPLTVTINLTQIGAGFSDYTARTIDGNQVSTVKSSLNTKTRHISFSLTSAKSFAIYGTRHKSAAGTIVGIFIGLLLLAGLVFGVLFLKRRMAADGPSAAVTAEVAQQAVDGATPPVCSHLNMAHEVQPKTDGCEECLAIGREWKALRICLTCGHVGCSDDSEGQDARKHYEQTGHPLIMVYGDPAAGNIGWCYADQMYI